MTLESFTVCEDAPFENVSAVLFDVIFTIGVGVFVGVGVGVGAAFCVTVIVTLYPVPLSRKTTVPLRLLYVVLAFTEIVPVLPPKLAVTQELVFPP